MKENPKRSRVLLLNPPTAAVSTEVLLNLAYLAASLRKAGHEAKIIDSTAPYKPYSSDEINHIISDFKPDFIGVTLTITYIPQTYAYLGELRRLGVPIVAGGPHANSLPEEALNNGCDIVAIGEGEETITELAEHFAEGRALSTIPGICYKDTTGEYKRTTARKLIENLDTIPFPDFSDFPIKNYTGSTAADSNPIFWSIFTSRGCPFDCTFCSSHNVFGRTARMRSAKNIFDEIASLYSKFGAKTITFQDDEILCSKKRFLELCDLILDARLKIKMSIRTRIDSIDKDILEKAQMVGLTRISFGIESWNDDTLTKINKKYKVDRIHKSFATIEQTRFPYVSFNNIIGFPWETEEHLKNNLKEISKIPASIDYFTSVCTVIPYPKTALYERYHKEFGFTGWWLDPKNHPSAQGDPQKPFFMLFAFMMFALFTPDVFWKYSHKTKKGLVRFSWEVFTLFMKRHYNARDAFMLISLCRASYFVWRLSPRMERLIFRPLFNKKIFDLRENISFISKY